MELRRVNSISNMIKHLEDQGDASHVNYFDAIGSIPARYVRQVLGELIEECPEARGRISLEAIKAHERFELVIQSLSVLDIRSTHRLRTEIEALQELAKGKEALEMTPDVRELLAKIVEDVCTLSATVDDFVSVSPELFPDSPDIIYPQVVGALGVAGGHVRSLFAIPGVTVSAVCDIIAENHFWPQLFSNDGPTLERWNIPRKFMHPMDVNLPGLLLSKSLIVLERWYAASHVTGLTAPMAAALDAIPALTLSVPAVLHAAVEDAVHSPVAGFVQAVAAAIADKPLARRAEIVGSLAPAVPVTEPDTGTPPVEHSDLTVLSTRGVLEDVQLAIADGAVLRAIVRGLLRRHIAVEAIMTKIDARLATVADIEAQWSALDKLVDVVEAPDDVVTRRIVDGGAAALRLVESFGVLHERGLAWGLAAWSLLASRSRESMVSAFIDHFGSDTPTPEGYLLDLLMTLMTSLVTGDRIVDSIKTERLVAPLLNMPAINGQDFIGSLEVSLDVPGVRAVASTLLPLIPDLYVPTQIDYPLAETEKVLLRPEQVREAAMALAQGMMVEEASVQEYAEEFVFV